MRHALEGRRILVTGGAGFIGSHLIPALLARGATVTAYDNLSLGRRELLAAVEGAARFRFAEADLLVTTDLDAVMKGHDCVFHLAANSNISLGRGQTDRDLQQGTLVTYNVLESMRRHAVRELVFASSSVVYGEARRQPTAEDDGPCLPISLYGASKLASEGLISAFCHNFGMRAWIYRFGNVVGGRLTHGVIFDFIRKLREDPATLTILGDGRQAKPYLHVDDCVAGMLFGWQQHAEPLSYFNLAPEGATVVRDIARFVVEAMGLADVRVELTGGARGWPGDVPQVRLDPSKLARLGWRASYTSDEAVQRGILAALRELAPDMARR